MKQHKNTILSALAGTVMVLGVIILCILFTKTTQETMFRESETYLGEITKQIAAQMRTECISQWKYILSLRQNIALFTQDAAEGYLETQKNIMDARNIYFLDDEGQCYDETGQQQSLLFLQTTDIASLYADEEQMVHVTYDEDSEEIVLFSKKVAPFIWKNHKISIIAMSYPAKSFMQRLEIALFDRMSNLYILHRDGTAIFRNINLNGLRGYNILNQLKHADPTNAALQTFSENLDASRMLELSYRGNRKYLCHTPIGVSDWLLIITVPVAIANQQLENQMHTVARIGVCMSLAAMLIAALIFVQALRAAKAKNQMALELERKANEAKSQFLANMSHDIRTPISAVMGMVQLAQHSLSDRKKLEACLNQMMLSAKHLLALINDILDMSKIQSGRMELRPEPCCLTEALDSIQSIIGAQAKAANQKFTVELRNLTADRLIFDPLRFNQLCLNILSNATKFTPENGEIHFIIEQQPAQRDDYVHLHLEFRDTGIGIKESFQAHIFDSFSREQDSKVDKIQGTGLGMAIAKNIVDMMGGQIALSSALGQGTTFMVELDFPCDKTAAPEWEYQPLRAMRVLVADSDAQAVQALVWTLGKMGAQGVPCYNGMRAVAPYTGMQQQDAPCDIVLLEEHLPLLDGRQAARAIYRARPQTPIFLMGDKQQIKLPIEGVSGVLDKPVQPQDLYQALAPYMKEDEHAQADTTPELPLAGLQILLAEDNAINREIAGDMLTLKGARVVFAENGKQAVEALAESSSGEFDLILMDIQMPICNGLQATTQIRQSGHPNAGLPIIAITANAFAEDREQALRTGMTDYITKPIDFEALEKLILRLLAKEE